MDHSRVLLPDAADSLGRSPIGMRFVAIERFLLFGLQPLAVVVLTFRDRPSRYGLAIGDWRAGAVLMLIYGWLAWRTRSILWGTIGHVYILSLVIVAAGAAAPA